MLFWHVADDMYVVPKKVEQQFGVYLDNFPRVALYIFEIQEYKEVAASTIHIACFFAYPMVE